MIEILKKQRQYNLENKILHSEITVIDRLLNREPEMCGVYAEASKKLDDFQNRCFWDRVIAIASHWNPESIQGFRNAKKNLLQLNPEIEATSRKLASLLKERTDLCNQFSFSAYTDYHVMDWIQHAAKQNYLFQSYLNEDLTAMRSQFDLKYWPTPAELVHTIANFAAEATVEQHDKVTEAAISSPRSSRADYLRALLKAIDEGREESPQQIPDDFKLTDESIANLANCSLGLVGEQLIDSQYIKRFRQRSREKPSE